MVSLTFSDVTKRFAGRTVIGHLSAELAGGTVTAVTGANGSGKSTLLKLAAKLLLPDEGKIVAKDGGQALSKASYRSRIGIVTPEFHAYPKLTARENLDFFLGFRRAAPLTAMQYEQLLARVGLSADVIDGKYVEHFSTGMKKRLHLAILLASEADIWLLDEPGANLDDAWCAGRHARPPMRGNSCCSRRMTEKRRWWQMHASLYRAIESVFRKEARISLRSRSSWLVVLMFALTTLSCVSLLMQGDTLAPRLAASMLWVILFFSLLAGAGRGFADEEQAGTLMALQVYGSSQAVLFGKGLFMAVLLFALSLLIVPMYLVLMDTSVSSWPAFLLTLLGGTYGMAMAGTLLSALMSGAKVQGGLLSILMLPVLLPILLPAIVLTASCFAGEAVHMSYLVGIALYDAIMTLAASLLFDFLWYED